MSDAQSSPTGVELDVAASQNGVVADPSIHSALAEALVALDPTLPEPDATALRVGVTLLLEAMSAGSTHLPIGPLDRPTLLEAFARHSEAPAHLVDRFLALATGADCALIGPAGSARPLIRTPNAFYTHRMASMETQLSDVLTEMLTRPFARYDGAALENALTSLLRRPPKRRGDTGKGARVVLSAEQQYAVLSAVHSPLCVVAGGPGTGKTSIVIALLRMYLQLGGQAESIALAAPTGKAAKRLHQSIHSQLRALEGIMPLERQLLRRIHPPSTIHRLLGYLPRESRFRHDTEQPLPQKLVIIDEVSMVDLALMTHLVRGMAADARLVLLGDPDQLPSVDAGAVLRDLVPSQCRWDGPWAWLVNDLPQTEEHHDAPHPMGSSAVRLTRSYRMDPRFPEGRHILQVARQIVMGDTRYLSAPAPLDKIAIRRQQPELVQFSGVELLRPAPNALDAVLGHWFDRHIAGGPHRWFVEATASVFDFGTDGFDPADAAVITRIVEHVERVKVLCLLREGPTGSEAVNALLHGRMVAATGDDPGASFVPGEPVIVLRNDYDRRIFNGDLGVVLRVRLSGDLASNDTEDHRIMVVFPRLDSDFAVFHLDALRTEISLAHGMTVHRSQGSEFEHSVVVFPDRDGPLLTRETLYTAVTRSRRSVLLFGDDALFGLATSRELQRKSRLWAHDR